MKKLFFLAIFITVGLFLQSSASLANDAWDQEGQNILDAIESFDSKSYSNSPWGSMTPTAEDIEAANKIENLAVKDSREDKLITAVKNGDLKNIKTFIAAGADLEARDNEDRTALMRAAEKGLADVVKILLDAGANVGTKTKFGWTALFIATDTNHVEVVKMLIARGAAPDQSFRYVFVSHVFKNNIDMVKALIGEGNNINRRTIDEACTVVRYENTDMVNILNQLKSQL